MSIQNITNKNCNINPIRQDSEQRRKQLLLGNKTKLELTENFLLPYLLSKILKL